MIDRAIQRGGGQNLASHLLKSFENEQITVAEVRGAVAQDLHGAFKEWWIASKATQCKQYLFTIAINPDPKQRPLTRDEFAEFIGRIEQDLGLAGQPRAVVFHTKDGREHAHVTWSRVYEQDGNFRAVQMDFYKDKLMRAAVKFAADHGLELPDGYKAWETKSQFNEKAREKTQADKQAERETGITREQHEALLTAAWRESDSAKAFLHALAERGYILARGDRRDYVTLDRYGGVHSLGRRIQGVKVKDVRQRLQDAFPLEQLPSVEQARKTIRQHHRARPARAREQFNTKAAAVHQEFAKAQQQRRDKLIAEFEEAHAGQPEEFREVERQRLDRNLKKIEAQELKALKEILLRRQRQGRRRGGDTISHYSSGAALEAARSTVAAIAEYDAKHLSTAPYVREVRDTFAEIGRLKGRARYAKQLSKDVRAEFARIYGGNAEKAYRRFEKEVEANGITRAANMLRRDPRRFGRLAGWQFTRLIRSKDRRQALALVHVTRGKVRKSYYLNLKIEKERERERIGSLEQRLEQFKREQREALQAPAEGRLFLQYMLAEAGDRIGADDYRKLTAQEKFALGQARRLMGDFEVKDWVKARMVAVMENKPLSHADGPAHPWFGERVKLSEISARELRRELGGLYRALMTRQEGERVELDRKFEEETRRILAKRHEGFAGRVIGGLAALSGLKSALERHRAAVDEKRAEAYRREFQELSARHREEEAPLTRGYRTLKTRERMRTEAALAQAREMALSAQFNEEAARGESSGGSGEDSREIRISERFNEQARVAGEQGDGGSGEGRFDGTRPSSEPRRKRHRRKEGPEREAGQAGRRERRQSGERHKGQDQEPKKPRRRRRRDPDRGR